MFSPIFNVGLVSALFICLCGSLWAATCSERNTSQLCWGQNNATNGYCYWYSPMWQVYDCAECKNTPVTLTNGGGNVFSGTLPSSSGADYATSCPMIYNCNNGYALNLKATVTSTGGTSYTMVCESCANDQFIYTNDRIVTVETEKEWWGSSQTIKETMYYVSRNNSGLATHATSGIVLGCQTCGAYAKVNASRTNCDCNMHYAYREIGTSVLETDGVGTNSCSPIEYYICFNHTSAKECKNFVRYQYKVGYDPYDTGNYGICPGCDLGYIMEHPTDNRYYFDSWWSGVNGTGKQYFPGNIIYEDSYNIAEECVKDTVCQIADIDKIHLYAKWLPKSYTVTYKASHVDKECNSQQSCKYDSDCVAASGASSTQACVDSGQILKGWKCVSGCSETLIEINGVIPEPAVGENIVLQAVPQDCSPGYYCQDETVYPCPAGTTSDAGAYSREMCKVTSETKFCDGNGFCFNLPISDGAYVK